MLSLQYSLKSYSIVPKVFLFFLRCVLRHLRPDLDNRQLLSRLLLRFFFIKELVLCFLFFFKIYQFIKTIKVAIYRPQSIFSQSDSEISICAKFHFSIAILVLSYDFEVLCTTCCQWRMNEYLLTTFLLHQESTICSINIQFTHKEILNFWR